ncbi:MAG: cytochrome c [Cardiobacteriaceae bacterium]|nr:cytochrome c [Cardiobacteriaceae bacterium]
MMRRVALSLGIFCAAAQGEDIPGVPSPARAESLYKIHCQGCHLPDGSGFEKRHVPNMKDRVGRFLLVPEGRAYLLQVPGAAGTPISDEELMLVTNWILWTFSRAQLPADYQPYTLAEVRELRMMPRDDINARRERLLEDINQLLSDNK